MKQKTAEARQLIKRARRNTLGDILTRTTERTPNKLAITYKELEISYQQLDVLVNQTAHTFLAKGFKKGERVAVMSKNSLDFVILNFALARAGIVMVPINYMLSIEDAAYILAHAGVKGLASSSEFMTFLDEAASELVINNKYVMDTMDDHTENWSVLDEERQQFSTEIVEVDVDDTDLCHILYTSGTESKPKGVMLSHQSIISEYVSCIVEGNMETNDRIIHALPLYHSAQLHVFLGPSIYTGGSGIILDSASPELILKTIEEFSATQLFCPPTVWISLLRHPDIVIRDLSSLTKCYYGAAIMPKEILKELTERLPNARFWNFYGQTEVAPLATVLQPQDQLRKLGSAGKPALNVQTKIVDEMGQEVPRGNVGEIVHRTPHAMLGYLHEPEKTAQAFRDGWFHSGDLGVMDKGGYITIVDRKKDMINTGGVNVSSREVEEVIYQLDGVEEVAVISIPDPYWIEAVTAIIVSKKQANLTTSQVEAFCRERLSKFKVPKHIIFTETLPKNPSGKVLKRSLRSRYENLL
ncbi:acyl-CoA synthetase [Virgibacillus proomii]|uniref:acyl-CoA synthetase n=1 Tax=Virgibacillus proomii TaxID=84407 RepID=UPI001C1108EF|nr:acyl-CoA synthetase [Virgibacillus proomii]MBU5266341.1 acyl-CoA synthetase [Virgibacillus proomii]